MAAECLMGSDEQIFRGNFMVRNLKRTRAAQVKWRLVF
jgi:hypothetical protein